MGPQLQPSGDAADEQFQDKFDELQLQPAASDKMHTVAVAHFLGLLLKTIEHRIELFFGLGPGRHLGLHVKQVDGWPVRSRLIHPHRIMVEAAR